MTKENILRVAWMWILFPSLFFFVGDLQAEADSDWIVTLRQSPGTKACVEGGWTRDGEEISHPGGFYSLCCEGEEKTRRIAKAQLAVQPNDADYDIRIWWPDEQFEEHNFERIAAPGSKTYTHSSPSYEVVFEVFPASAPIPTVSQRGLIIMVLGLATAGAIVIWRKRKVGPA